MRRVGQSLVGYTDRSRANRRIQGTLWWDGQCLGANPRSRRDHVREFLTPPGWIITLTAILWLNVSIISFLHVSHELCFENFQRPIQTAQFESNLSFLKAQSIYKPLPNRKSDASALSNKEGKTIALVKSWIFMLCFLMLRTMSSDKERS